MPEEMQKSETVGARLKRLIQAKKLDKLSYREWRERLQKHGQPPSEATISRDLRWDTQKIPIQRLELWAKAIGIPIKQLVNREELADQMRQPKPPKQEVVQAAKYWAFCPYKHCPTGSWAVWKQTGEPAKFRDYGWFNAEEEGRFCRKCGTELVKGCRTQSCKQRIENRGDLYCGKCGKRFAETAVIAPQELWNRAVDDDWKHYTSEQQAELLENTLLRLHTDFNPPVGVTEKLAKCLEHCVLSTKRRLRPDGMIREHLKSLHMLESVVRRLNEMVPPLMSAVRVSNPAYFATPDREPDGNEEWHKAWQENLRKSGQGSDGQGDVIEPSEAGDVAVQVPPPEEPDIPF